jgi:hypothetical protein
MTTQISATRLEPRWKKVIIVSTSAGAGFALTLAVIVGSVLWYGSHPRPPKPWNTRAIRAKYRNAEQTLFCTGNGPDVYDNRGNDLTPDEFMQQKTKPKKPDLTGDVVLRYDLQNTTDYDYRIAEQSSLQTMERRENILNSTGDSLYTLKTPVFVPARHTVSVDVHCLYECAPPNQDKLKSFLKEVPELVLFDSGRRYEIELPKPTP